MTSESLRPVEGPASPSTLCFNRAKTAPKPKSDTACSPSMAGLRHGVQQRFEALRRLRSGKAGIVAAVIGTELLPHPGVQAAQLGIGERARRLLLHQARERLELQR